MGYGYVPHTDEDRSVILARLGVEKIEDLFSHIPPELRSDGLDPESIPGPMSEQEVAEMLEKLALKNEGSRLVCFAGGGAYDEYVPAAVAEIASRPEFKTAYTPYQPEVSQGVLQALFEYQSMVCRLTGMEVANASVYDGASAVVEAANMAIAITGRRTIAVSGALNPRYSGVLETFARGRGLDIRYIPVRDCATEVGGASSRALPSTAASQQTQSSRSESSQLDEGVAAVIFQQPNYFGVLEDAPGLVEEAHSEGALAVAVCDPISLGLLKRPGDYGADIAVAEGQPLGNPLNFGGPYLGIMATKDEFLRFLPGRISGMTVDADGRTSFALALQGREQHIRREKASSNICTNQTLVAIAAAAYLAWVGPQGLRQLAENSVRKAHYLASRLAEIDGFALATKRPFFREFPLFVPDGDVAGFITSMAKNGILAGIPVAIPGDDPEDPSKSKAVLIAVASRRRIEEVEAYIRAASRVGK
jgi:glycine dehydrogenase subunit 1